MDTDSRLLPISQCECIKSMKPSAFSSSPCFYCFMEEGAVARVLDEYILRLKTSKANANFYVFNHLFESDLLEVTIVSFFRYFLRLNYSGEEIKKIINRR